MNNSTETTLNTQTSKTTEAAQTPEKPKAPRRKEKTRGTGFLVTINLEAYTSEMNYDNLDKYVDKIFKTEKPEFFCFCEESGDETGNIHIHLYVETKNQHTQISIRKKFPLAHVDVRNGTPTQCRDYVFKSETKIRPAVEFGDFSRLGKIQKHGMLTKKEREKDTPINDTVVFMLDNYNTLEEMAEYNPFIYNQMHRTIEKMFYQRKVERFKDSRCSTTTALNRDTIHEVNRKVYYLWGSTATGKTKGIMRKHGNDVSILTQLKSDMKYDDYKNTGIMVLDEFYSQLKVQEMLNLVDGYITELPCRYYNKSNVAHTIIMTSNVPFSAQYEEAKIAQPEKYKAFVRRVNAGEWEMYQIRAGDRYIACHTDLTKIEKRLRGLYDLSEPPIALEGSEDGAFKAIKQITSKEMAAVKYLDGDGLKVTKKAIKEFIKKLPF